MADAGPDVSAKVAVPVTVDGSGSYGRNGLRSGASDLITFEWKVVQAPDGSAAGIEAASPAPAFVADRPGAYVLQLVVTDSSGARSAPDEMTLTAFDGDAPPNVRAGRARAVLVGAPVELDASRSFDPEGLPVTFQWWLVSAPEGSRVTDSSVSLSESARPSFTPDVAGTYVLQVQVSDGESNEELGVTVSATARDLPPFADAGPDQRLRPGEAVHLSGAGNGVFSWSLVARPAGSALTSASIRGADRASAELTPDAAGIYICRLEATDGRQSDGDNVLILVKENGKPRAAADTAATSVYSSVDIDVLANDSDPDGDPLSISAVGQGSQGTVEIRSGSTIRYRPNPGALGTDSFLYSVADGHGGTDTAAVTVTISTLGQPVVESFSPSSGRIGDAVTLNGLNLGNTAGVSFARIKADFTVLSPTRVSAVVPANAASGPITVSTPGGSFTTAQPFVVTAAPDFAVAVLPSSLRLRVGEAGAVHVTLKEHGDSPSAAALSVRGLPAGATASFTVAKLAAGHGTTLRIEASPTTPNGSSLLIVTATSPADGSVTHSAAVTLEVFGAPIKASPIACGDADLSGLSERIYVSPSGADTAGCGLAVVSACASVSQGIARCGASGCGVLVRYGLYPTSATIALRDGVSVFGGCDFSGTGRKDRTVIEASPAPGTPALSAVSINTPTTVHGLVVLGKNETAPGAASIAMAVTVSRGLTLADSALVAGKGGEGAPGGNRPKAQPGGDGGSIFDPGAGHNCPSNRTASAGDGGKGGDEMEGNPDRRCFFFECPCDYPNIDDTVGRPGTASGSVAGGPGGGRSIAGPYCYNIGTQLEFNGKTGGPGSTGVCAAVGGMPSPLIWGQPKPNSASWLPAAGGSGAEGSVGSGGGGGSSSGYCVEISQGIYPSIIPGNSGGGGGGGGCGGIGGAGGQQGGASISLILVNSAVAGVPARNNLVPGPGGRGGDGGAGGPGGQGGGGYPGFPAGDKVIKGYNCPGLAGPGGAGGQGGAGSGGAGGNGGPSIGLALVSGSPDPTTPGNFPGIFAGMPGEPGLKGNGGQNDPTSCRGGDGSGGVAGGTAFVVNLDNPPAAAAAEGLTASAPDAASACPPECGGQTVTARNFSNLDLTNANFAGATIVGVEFVRANLTGAKFDGATFQGIPGLPTSVPDFTLANLTNASFTNAKFEAPTYLTFANLACADFSGTDITNGNAVFGDEPLRYNSPASCRTKFQGTTMNCDFIDDWKGFDLTRANVNACITRLAGRDFSGAVLSGVNLGGAVLDGALFVGADLTLAVLDYASLQCRNQQAFPPTECVDLSHALLQGAQLNQANLSGATLYKAFLSNKPAPNPIPQAAKLKHAHLLNVNLAGAQLSGADFSWANFYGDNTGPCGTTGGKDLSGFTKGCSTAAGAVLTGTHFANAYLFGLDFGSAQIAGVDFDSAVLVGANFSGATIGIDSNTGFGTKFTRAFLQGTNLDLATTLSGADLSNAFVTFRVSDNNSIDIGLDGANHNQFACSTPSTCGPAPGQGVCVNVFFPPTTVPGNNPSITCPDGFPAGSSGCGDASSGGNLVNLRWNSHLSIDAASPPGWYKRDATYTPKAPDSAVCNKKGPSAEVTDW